MRKMYAELHGIYFVSIYINMNSKNSEYSKSRVSIVFVISIHGFLRNLQYIALPNE
jgi:hypothetical protein